MRDLGWIEGQNIAFESRHAAEKYETLPSLAAELVSLQPDVILAVGTPASLAAKSATQTIPVVFARIGDPVGAGLVPSIARPGGNLTGVSLLYAETATKRLEFIATVVPGAARVGVLWDPNFRNAVPELRETERAARSLNVELIPAEARGPDEFEPALRTLMEKGASAVLVLGAGVFIEHSEQLADLTVKVRIPAVFYRREFVDAGGLMSYAANFSDNIRRAAAYVDKILKGAKPADLPVEQPTKLELVIDLKTAKALGLTIPPMLLARADEVIE
jgi:putative ABC transport system substrate-binding protein